MTNRTTRIQALVVFLAAIALPACAGGRQESGQQPEETEQSQQTSVTRTVVANPEEMQQAFMEVAEKVLPVVVEVNVLQFVQQQPQSLFEYFFGQPEGQQQPRPGLGSGVIVRTDGDTVYVVTNYHVVSEADRISIVLEDGREFDASLVGGDQRTDLALLEFQGAEDIPVVELADSDEARVGQWVIAVGNPFGFESSVTVGIVSALGRSAQAGMPVGSFTEYIQTDAAINPGNSGGALVDLDGRLIGVNAWIASQSGGSAGVGFAIPSQVVSKVIGDLIEEGRVIYGWLGVTALDPSARPVAGLAAGLEVEGRNGVVVNNIHQGAPADTDGLLPGDFITSVGGIGVQNFTEFARAIGSESPGTEIDLALVRYGSEQSVTVTLDRQPPRQDLNNPANLWPGMTVVPITNRVRNQTGIPSSVEGVIAIGVVAESPAAAAGIQRGDIVVGINGTDTPNVIPFYRALNEAGQRFPVQINRAGREIRVRLQR
jgi:serine protease Do